MPTEVVRAAIFKEWEFVLLQQRPNWSKLAPDHWQLPGGQKIQEDKNLESAMLRKLTQELGLNQAGIVLAVISRGHGKPDWPTTVFRADLDSNNLKKLQPSNSTNPNLGTNYEELSRCRWFSKNEIAYMLKLTKLSKEHPLLATVLNSVLSTRLILEGKPIENRFAFDTGDMVINAYQSIEQFGT